MVNIKKSSFLPLSTLPKVFWTLVEETQTRKQVKVLRTDIGLEYLVPNRVSFARKMVANVSILKKCTKFYIKDPMTVKNDLY